MPFVFGIAGVLLVVSGVRGTTLQLMTLAKNDFVGSPNYFEWVIAIFLVGALGYIKELATISRMFMVLVVIGLLWSNKGFFSEFTQGTESAPIAPATDQTNQSTQQSPSLSTLPSLTDLEEQLTYE